MEENYLENLNDADGYLPLPQEGASEDDYSSVMEHRLRGEVMRFVYANEDSSYCVIRLKDTSNVVQTLVGSLKGVMEGQTLEAVGHWELHKDHGRQFRVTRFQAVLPTSPEGVRKYLASGVLPGIGEIYANRIVDAFGVDALKVLDEHPEKLKKVPGIGKKRYEEICAAWKSTNELREADVFLQGIGLSPAFAERVKTVYGAENAAEIVRRNPYRLAMDVEGIGFLTADRIAMNMGIAHDAPIRLSAGVYQTLMEFAQSGHVCVTKEQLFESAAGKLSVSGELLEGGLRECLAQGRIVEEVSYHSGQGVPMYFTRMLRKAEMDLAEAIRVLLSQSTNGFRVPERALDVGYQRLNERQKAAVQQAFSTHFSIITGGPGVGKTTVVSQIVAAAKRMKLKLLLAAPTGRAAKRMSEGTGETALTIHRLLKWDAHERRFLYDADQPLEGDVLIVDEVSMLDTALAASLFRALPAGIHVILVGDKDQLPSVGAGAVLHDLIGCGLVPVTELTEIYRQAAGSRIITNAHAVNAGRMPDCRPLPNGQRGDFYWVEQENSQAAADIIIKTIVERIPAVFGYNPMNDVQVLSPMRKGDCGTDAMNTRLQNALNPPSPQKETYEYHGQLFRTGDRVMQIKNNYDKGVFNGEMGRICFVDSNAKRFTVQFDSVQAEYSVKDSNELVLAYAVTVHKSQGSEYPVVILPVQTQHFIMLQRNLVYTGMTRAKKLLIMVGTYRALSTAVRNDTPMMRQTMLVERLQQR